MSAWTWPRNRGGSARPARCSRVFGERARDVDRGEGHRPVQDVDAEAPRVDPVADPHLGVGGATGREAEHEPGLRLAQDHPVVHDMAALVEQQGVARAAGLDVGDVARVEPLQGLDHVRAGHDELAERADVAERDAFADRPVLGDRVAVVPRPPPAAESVHPRAEREVLLVQRRAPEGVDVRVGGRLAERDLARRRSGGEGRGHLAGPRRDPRADVGQARAALARAEAGLAGALEELELLEALRPRLVEVRDGRAHARADDAVGRRRWERRLLGRGADHGERHLAGHPREHVAGCLAQPEDDGAAGVVVSTPVASSMVTTARTRPSSSPSNRARRPSTAVAGTPAGTVPMATASSRVTPAACNRSAARAVNRPRSPLPGQTGWISAAPVATTISSAWTWSIPVRVRTTRRGRRRSRRPRRPPRRRAPAPSCPRVPRSPPPRARPSRHRRPRHRPRRAACSTSRPSGVAVAAVVRTTGSGGKPSAGWLNDRQPRSRRRLARSDVCDAIDRREAVPAVAGQAQRSAAPRCLRGAKHRDRHGIARLEGAGRHRRPADRRPRWSRSSLHRS